MRITEWTLVAWICSGVLGPVATSAVGTAVDAAGGGTAGPPSFAISASSPSFFLCSSRRAASALASNSWACASWVSASASAFTAAGDLFFWLAAIAASASSCCFRASHALALDRGEAVLHLDLLQPQLFGLRDLLLVIPGEVAANGSQDHEQGDHASPEGLAGFAFHLASTPRRACARPWRDPPDGVRPPRAESLPCLAATRSPQPRAPRAWAAPPSLARPGEWGARQAAGSSSKLNSGPEGPN